MKKKNLIIFLIILLAISSSIIPKNLGNLDELWNYNFARNIAEGNLPYKDFNIIVTPLLPIIVGVFLKLIANELIVMRLIAVIVSALILFITYKILELLKVNNVLNIIAVFLIYWLFNNIFCLDYNFSILLIALLLIYLELKRTKKNENVICYNKKFDFFIGFLAGISILFKQTTGIFLSLICIGYKILLVRKKEDLKITLKIIITRTIGVLVPIILLLTYLIVNNILYEFWDYCFLGIKTFNNSIPYTFLLKGSYGLILQILSIIIPVLLICTFSFIITKKMQNNLLILFAYSIACFIVVFPISDKVHFLIGIFPALILLTVLINNLLKTIKLSEKNSAFITQFLNAITACFLVGIIIYSSYILLNYFKNVKEYNKYEHFKYIPVNIKSIDVIDEFILEKEFEGKKVYILDASAAAYMIPIDRYNKDFDMFNLGNLGSKGEEGQIEKIEQMDSNVLILIMSDNYKRNWQNPEKVREYIVENLNKTGEFGTFDIYEKE